MKRYIDYLIRSEEHRVDEMLFLQIKDKNDLCYGLMRGDVIEATVEAAIIRARS